MECQRIVALLSAELDGALPVDESQAARAHLSSCPDCAKRFALLDETRRAYRESMADPPARQVSRIVAAVSVAIVAVVVAGMVLLRTDRSSLTLNNARAAIDCGITGSASCVVEVAPCRGSECALLLVSQ